MVVRTRAQSFAMLAVILAVNLAVNRSLRLVQNWQPEFAE
jgi:hypothetical protein